MSNSAAFLKSHSEQIRICGLVQGVGFRPAVWQIAHRLGIRGEVRNDGSGVIIIAQTSPHMIHQLLQELQLQPPALARIDSIQREVIDSALHFSDFNIQQSRQNEIHTGIVPDAATCSECLQDIRDPHNRRFEYAFTNCTHCGPRFSIIRDIPYDRAQTSMAKFVLCCACRSEYEDPAQRRFHAQPNACPVCGPQLLIRDNRAKRIPADQPLKAIARLINEGHIIAIKGLGGFQLACDAGNIEAVQALRIRKRRPHKALALMAKSIHQIQQYCTVSDIERAQLESTAAPIVLLNRRHDADTLCAQIAPGQNTLGFMLPNSPLHHLLLERLDRPVVLTSGNRTEEPQCIDDTQALSQLAGIADYFLMHNRDIINRIDDSVLRVVLQQVHYLRRARGFAPQPLKLPEGFENSTSIFACGSEMKNTFCLIRDDQATLSQHIGNLENAHTYDDYLHNIGLYQRLFQFNCERIAVDQHPEYLSSKYGRAQAVEQAIPLEEVQHHHAHIAACLADNGWPLKRGKVIGVVLDGLGFGDDGTIWGGEFLVADYEEYERLGRLQPVPLPGGVKAIQQPWRNTYAQLTQLDEWPELKTRYANLELMQDLSGKPLAALDQMMLKGFNSPLSSSCGRLFDAVAAAAGICSTAISYEGQAAIELENCIKAEHLQQVEAYPFCLQQHDLLEISTQAVWPALLEDLHRGAGVSVISARFHRGLAKAIVDMIIRLHQQSGISTVALSGGVFQNRTLFTLCMGLLRQHPLKVLFHQQLPANDGAIALGQAVIAAARATRKEKLICV